MKLETEYVLSFYEELAPVKEHRDIALVRHLNTGKLFLKKELEVYDRVVFEYLAANPSANLPGIAETIEDDGKLIVVEEYISGDLLSDVLKARGPLPEQEAAAIVISLCGILEQLHSAVPPIVHRDIKPANIILSADGVLKLIDFDAAKTVRGDTGQDTVLFGTNGYAAPEQYGFAESSPLTDIYAAGVLLNELLTGLLPNQRMADGKLGAIVKKCTEMDPRMRFQNVGQLKSALEKSTPAEPVKNTAAIYSKSWMIPGFRTRKPWKMVLAVLGYAAILGISLNAGVEDITGAELWVDRFCTLFFLLGIVLFASNYRGVHALFPLTRSRNVGLKVLGVIIGSVVILLMTIIIMVPLELIFG